MTPFFQNQFTTLYQGDCREIIKALPDESVNCVVTSPPYFGVSPYYAIIPLWQKMMADSSKVSAVALQLNLRRGSTGDQNNHTGISNGSSPSTLKSNVLRARLPQKSDARTRTFCTGLKSTAYRDEASLKQDRLSIGDRLVKLIQCTAKGAHSITTGRAAALLSDNHSIRLSNGQGLHQQYGNETRQGVKDAPLSVLMESFCTFITSFLFELKNYVQSLQTWCCYALPVIDGYTVKETQSDCL